MEDFENPISSITAEVNKLQDDIINFWRDSAKYWREAYFDLSRKMYPTHHDVPKPDDFGDLI